MTTDTPRTATPPRYGARAARRNLAAALALALAAFAVAAQDAPPPAVPGPVTIVALGDSLTQGYGLPEPEGFVPQLQAWLRANGAPQATVINAGVSGDTTAGGLARIGWTLEGEADAVIVALGGNDLLRGLAPEESRANLDGILAAIEARGLPVLLAGLPAPANYGPEFQAAFDAMFPELAEAHGAALYPNFLAGLAEGRDLAAARHLMQPDGIHPNAAGVEAIVAAIGPAALALAVAAAGD